MNCLYNQLCKVTFVSPDHPISTSIRTSPNPISAARSAALPKSANRPEMNGGFWGEHLHEPLAVFMIFMAFIENRMLQATLFTVIPVWQFSYL